MAECGRRVSAARRACRGCHSAGAAGILPARDGEPGHVFLSYSGTDRTRPIKLRGQLEILASVIGSCVPDLVPWEQNNCAERANSNNILLPSLECDSVAGWRVTREPLPFPLARQRRSFSPRRRRLSRLAVCSTA